MGLTSYDFYLNLTTFYGKTQVENLISAPNLKLNLSFEFLIHPSSPGTSKTSPMAFMASDNFEDGMTQEQVEIEVLIARMFMLFELRAEKKVPAIPGASRKWGPKMETTAISE